MFYSHIGYARKGFSTIQIIVIMLLLMFSLLTIAKFSYSQETHSPHILILNSYHEGFQGTDEIVRGFRTVVTKAFPDASIKTEYLDSKYYSGAEYDKILSTLMSYKYKKYHFDLIVASDDFAFNIVEKSYNDLFPTVPVVFCGTNSFDVKRLDTKEHFVGVDERPSFKESIDIVFRLRPQTKRIVVICDDSITGQLNREAFRSAASNFSMKTKFE